MKNLFLLCVAFLALVATGCSHGLHITNLDENFSAPPQALTNAPSIGVMSSSDIHPQNSKYIVAIIDALKRTGGFKHVIYPYSSASNEEVDAILDLTVIPKYSGRGSNFFVNWPGFLIFAPAIWGYGYIADINTVAVATFPGTNTSREISVHSQYKFRQAELDRTWTELGWLEVGIIPLIGGIVFMQYDEDVTNEFIMQVSTSYGPFVANKIVASLPPDLGQATGSLELTTNSPERLDPLKEQ